MCVINALIARLHHQAAASSACDVGVQQVAEMADPAGQSSRLKVAFTHCTAQRCLVHALPIPAEGVVVSESGSSWFFDMPLLQEGRFEEAALLRTRQVELVEALTAAVDAGPRLPRVRPPCSRTTLQWKFEPVLLVMLPACVAGEFVCIACLEQISC